MSVLKEKAKVIMLPTENESNFYTLLGNQNQQLYLSKGNIKRDLLQQNQHLYIVSNEEIKEGDWWINLDDNSLNNDKSIAHLANNAPSCKKVVATTDTSLREHDDTVPYPKTRPALPQPTQGFIEKYIKEYNKGNIITDILVEMTNPSVISYKGENGLHNVPSKLKVSKDNTITIHPVKDSWSREEVEDLLKNYRRYLDKYPSVRTSVKRMDKWIEKNLY